jgi:copper ion binding protein
MGVDKFFMGRKAMEKIKIQGMTCQHCVMSVSKALNSIPGLKNVRVNLVSGEATFENSQSVSPDKIRQAVEDAGYKVAI